MTSATTFGKYMLLERINIGGMAEVFKAKTFGIEGFERILAVKRILPNMAEDEEFINMFIDEARIAVQLSHPNVVSIYELGKYEGQYYIAMEYVPGKDLRQLLDRFRKRSLTMPIPAAAYLVSKICEGLDYAHRKADPGGRPLNLIHRDVSPQNILVSYEGAVKITDFGIVKAEDRASKTQAGVLKGKFGYMSPEQVRGLEIDRRSDIFAVGILLYEALTGKRLFIGESDFSTLEKVRNAEVVPPSQHNPEVSEALERLVLKALARERDERYQWAMELHDDLQRFLIEGETIFNAQRLGSMLKEEYSHEIADEAQKMEQFLRLPPPDAALSAAAEMRSVPTGDWNDNRAEKTMIFESGGGFEATTAAPPLSGLEGLAAEPLPGMPTGVPTLNQSATVLPAARPPRRPLGALLGAGVVVLGLLTALVYLMLDKEVEFGTVKVTSTPTDIVDIYMDDQLIAQKTPVVRPNVPAGEHTLWARAPGYSNKAYRFDLVAGGAPAEIKVELERSAAGDMSKDGAAAGEAGAAMVEISSEPAQATVRLAGVPQSTTPYSLPVRDTSHPLVLEVVKPGYSSQMLTINLAPGERHKSLHVTLVPLPGTAKEREVRPSAPGKLIIHSRPEGCLIYLNGVDRGLTPADIPDLDTQQRYSLELLKEGYRPHRESISFAGRTAVAVSPSLQPERRRLRPAPLPVGCAGGGGRISIMPVGIADCKVTVGRMALGVAPVFKKDCPVGRCAVDVRCPNGKRYQTTLQIRAGEEKKIIIKAEQWQ